MNIRFFDRLVDYYNRLSIEKKLKFMGVSTVALVGVISIFFILIYQYSTEKTLLKNHVRTLTMVVADNIAPAVLFDDREQIDKILRSLHHKEEVQHAYALDRKSKIVGEYHIGQDTEIDRAVFNTLTSGENQQWQGLSLYTRIPIVADGQQVGSIIIVASIDAFIYQMLVEILVWVLIVAGSILMTYRYRLRLRDSILKPIAELNKLTGRIIATKNLRETIPVYNEDEIGALAKSFSTMLADLDRTHQELNRQKDSLAFKAHHDALTGLPNRALFNDRLKHAISKARRHKEEIALFFIDLDHFKQINDTLGHEVGDEVLKFFAERLKASVRTEDTIARMGGDEFMVIMENLQTPEAISVVANKIVSIVKEPICLADQTLNLGTSIGIGVFPRDGDTAETLIKNADTAMYKAKSEGRDNYQFYTSEMKQFAIERMEKEEALKEAFERGAFLLSYRRRVHGVSREPTGFEARVKWNHPTKGLRSCGTLAEEMGLMVQIEEWLLRTVTEQLGQWRRSGIDPLPVTLNLSMASIVQSTFVPNLREMFDRYGCGSTDIEIALDEAELMNDPEASVTALEKVAGLGVKITIRDFGAALSSFAYLERLQVSNLMIAGRFIRELIAQKADTLVVKTIIGLAQNMHLHLIVDNIDTAAFQMLFDQCDCDLIEGDPEENGLTAVQVQQILEDRRS